MGNNRSSDASLRGMVIDKIRDWITGGVLEPGDRLVEAQLARKLGVSRGPVREAIQVLSEQGFVELRPSSSPQVANPSIRDIMEDIDVRIALERLSCRLAAQNCDEDDVGLMEELQSAGRKALREGDWAEAGRLNDELHLQFAVAGRNQRLVELIRQCDARLTWMIRDVARTRGEGLWEEHDEVIAAIRARDADLAESLAVAHIHASRDAYITTLTSTSSAYTRPSRSE